MGEWNRSTNECQLQSLRAEMVEAIKKHIETYNLGPILDAYLMCIETVSEKKKKGLFGSRGDTPVVVDAILTPGWLVWAVREKSGVTALSAQLGEVGVADYADTPGYKVIPDTGIEITGKFTGRVGMDGNERVSMFIGLGEGPDALKFKEKLSRAIQEAKRK